RMGFAIFTVSLLTIAFSSPTKAFPQQNPISSTSKVITGRRQLTAAVNPTGVTFTATENQVFTGVVASFTSADNSFTATIDWGDGTPTPGVVSGGGGTFSVTGTHTYADDGTKSVTVTIHDNTDNSNAIANSTAHVAEETFSITGGATLNTVEGVPVTNFTVAT